MKKRPVVCILSTLLLLSACGKRDNAEPEAPLPNTSAAEQVSETVTSLSQIETPVPTQLPTHTPSPVSTLRPSPTPEPSPTPDMSTVFPGVFNDMAAGVGVYGYDECVKRINETGFEYKIGGSLSRRKIQFSEADGFVLCLWFIPDDDGQSVLSSVEYYDVNTNYEIDVTDNDHSTQNVYTVYDEESTPTNTEVPGIEDLYAFIYEEMPRRTELYREAVKDNKMINVSLEASAEVIDDAVFITVETNLPDGTELMINPAKNGQSIAHIKAIVSDGKAVSEGITDNGKPLSGKYRILVVMPWPRLQPKGVMRIIGKNGEFLTGPYVIPSLLTPALQAQRAFDFEF